MYISSNFQRIPLKSTTYSTNLWLVIRSHRNNMRMRLKKAIRNYKLNLPFKESFLRMNCKSKRLSIRKLSTNTRRRLFWWKMKWIKWKRKWRKCRRSQYKNLGLKWTKRTTWSEIFSNKIKLWTPKSSN